MEQYGWAIGVGIIIIALSLSKAVPALVRAVADRIAARNATPLAGAIASPAPQALDDLQRRVAELEERVDFAERLLAKQREAGRLAKPPS
jgi:tetrahydromethanopterin S-methyltransferase subunit G